MKAAAGPERHLFGFDQPTLCQLCLSQAQASSAFGKFLKPGHLDLTAATTRLLVKHLYIFTLHYIEVGNQQ